MLTFERFGMTINVCRMIERAHSWNQLVSKAELFIEAGGKQRPIVNGVKVQCFYLFCVCVFWYEKFQVEKTHQQRLIM